MSSPTPPIPAAGAPVSSTARVKRSPVVIVVAAMLASLLLVFGVDMARTGPTPEELLAVRMKGTAAPDFALRTTDGKVLHLSDLRGYAVVLNFWATTCGPCKIEMPWFVELQRQYGPQGLQVIGIDKEDGVGVEEVASFARNLGVDYPILVGTHTEQEIIGNNYGGIDFLPETFYIGRDGKVSEKTIGLKNKSSIESSIRAALAQGPVRVAEGQGNPGAHSSASEAGPKSTME